MRHSLTALALARTRHLHVKEVSIGNKLTNLTIFRFAGRASRVPAAIALLAGALFLAGCGGGGGAAPAEDPPADEVPADSPAPPAPLGPIERVSLHSDGTQANGLSTAPAISADGRYVAFWSDATNLVDGDSNAFRDVFVRDTVAGTTTRVSQQSAGGQSTSGGTFVGSFAPAISGDGRYVAFDSPATDLVAGDSNALSDIFVRDTVGDTTTLVSVHSDGTQGAEFPIGSYAPAISADGRYVTFLSEATNLVDDDTNLRVDVFVRDTVAGTTTRVSLHSDGSESTGFQITPPAISGDGRYVAFYTDATNLVTGDSNFAFDVLVRDTVAGTTTRVSVDSAGAQANSGLGVSLTIPPAISGDGRYVAFDSLATNLVAGDSNGVNDVFRAPAQ